MSPPKSLMELAIMAIIKNIKELKDVGDLPFELLKDILPKVDSAHQMRQIEINSPHLEGKTAEIWLKIIERDFPLEYKANPYKPQDPGKWFRIWEKYKKEHDNALAASEAILKNALAGLRQDKEKNTSKIVEGKHLPGAARVGPKRQHGPRDTSTSVLTFGGGSRTKTSNGASVMRKVRREVKEIATIHSSLSRPVKAPSRLVKKAPEAMVNDQRRSGQPTYRPVPKEPAKLSALELHEQRATFLSDSEEEKQDDDAPNEKTAVKPQQSSVQPATKPVARKPATSALQRKFGRSPVKQAAPTTAPKQQGSSKPAASKPQDKVTSPITPQKPSSSSKPANNGSPSGLPQTRSSPPCESSSPQSVEELLSALEQPAKPAVQPRKRKAVDIFMRPKRRAM